MFLEILVNLLIWLNLVYLYFYQYLKFILKYKVVFFRHFDKFANIVKTVKYNTFIFLSIFQIYYKIKNMHILTI